MPIILDLPTSDFATADFTLYRQTATARMEGGGYSVAEIGDPFWKAKLTTIPLEHENMSAWRAWASGGIKPFYCHDPSRAYPIAYGKAVLNMTKAGGGAFNGEAELASWTATTLTLSGLPASYEVRAGDLMSFSWGNYPALHMATAAVTASESGVVTVTVEPAVRLEPAPVAGAVVSLVKARCAMMLAPDSFSATVSAEPSPVSFEAVQVIV